MHYENKYSKNMAKNGRKGGTQKGLNYRNKRRKCIELFISNSLITLNEIAQKIGVSQAFVSNCTNYNNLKALRYSQQYDIQRLLKLDDEQFKALVLKDEIEEDLKKYERIKNSDDYKQLKNNKLLKF